MIPEDKRRLQTAFNEALARHPNPDEAIEGMNDSGGNPMSYRRLVALTLASEQFYREVERAVEEEQLTLDQIVNQITGQDMVKLDRAHKTPPPAPK